MPSPINALQTLLPYHMMCYGTLLGFQLYQSFINTRLCYLHLPRPQFTQLQKRVFPVYFKSQITLTVLTALTHPPYSLVSIKADSPGIALLSSILGLGMLNWIVYGPKTTEAMVMRAQQETKEGRGPKTLDPKSPEMKYRDRQFSRNHAMAIHLNLLAMIGTVFYGIWFSSRLSFQVPDAL